MWHKLSLLSSLSRSSQKHISSHFVIVLCCFAKIYSSYPFLKKLASQKEKKKTRFKLVLKHFTQQNNCTEHLWTVFIQNPRRNIQQRESNVTVEWLGVRRLFEREQMKTAHCKVCGLSWVNLAMICDRDCRVFQMHFFGALWVPQAEWRLAPLYLRSLQLISPKLSKMDKQHYRWEETCWGELSL